MKALIESIKANKKLSIAAVLIIAAAFYFGYRGQIQTATPAAEAEMATVKRGNLEISVTGSGQVSAGSQVDLRPQVAGDGADVLQVAVKNNQKVSEGQLIAALDYADAQKSVRDAELSLWGAEIKMKQTKKLYTNETEDDRYNRQTQEISLSQARNKLADAREKLQDYYIQAPFDGIVTGLSVEAGDSVTRDEILASVITDKLMAKVSLTEVDVVSVKEGNNVKLFFDAIEGLQLDGEVTRIDTIGKVSQNVVYYEAEIAFSDSSGFLKPGMSVSAEIMTASKRGVLLVPSEAVKSKASGDYVLVPDMADVRTTDASVQPKYAERAVKAGASDGVMTEIESGLAEGQTIITRTAAEVAANSATASNQGQGLFNMFRPGGGGGNR